MKFYEHKSYIGSCADLPKDDDRMDIFEEQCNERGFDDTITWSFDHSLVKFILPRLKRYYEIAQDTIIIEDEFDKALNTMISGFELYLSEDFDEFDVKHVKKLNESYKELAEWHSALWW